jgi:transposase
MFWGCITREGFGPLVMLPRIMNSIQYCELLEEVVKPYLDDLERRHGRKFIFMQDNAPCHAAKRVTAKFKELGIRTLRWPPSSPDLNPIENVWATWKRRRNATFGNAANRHALKDQAEFIWSQFTKQEAINLLDSFRGRLQAVIQLEGAAIRY